MKTRSYFAAIGLASFCWFETGAAAETLNDADRARAVFREARAFVTAGNYAEACPRFEESLKLDVGIGTKFNLADCFEHIGRPASAKTLFLEVAERAHESGQAEREAVARARAAALDAAIPQMILDVSVAVPQLTVRRDGIVVEPSAWGGPQPVDPGKHEIVASAPGKKPWSTKVDVSITASPLTVSVPELTEMPVATRTQGSAPEAAKMESTDESPSPPLRDNTVPILLYAGVGTGVLLTSAALIFYKVSNDKAETICPASRGCSTDEVQGHARLVNDAINARTLAYVGMGLTGASLAAGAIVYLARSEKKERPPSSSLRLAPFVSRDELGGALQGAF